MGRKSREKKDRIKQPPTIKEHKCDWKDRTAWVFGVFFMFFLIWLAGQDFSVEIRKERLMKEAKQMEGFRRDVNQL